MSKLYRDSKESKRAYYEQFDAFRKGYNKYSLYSHTITSSTSSPSNKYDLGKGGVPLSMDEEGEIVYIDQTDSHTLIIGPTGSKKSRLVAMPTVKLLGLAKESIIISDPKAEIYGRTAKQLHTDGYDVVVLNLRAPDRGEGWNPLAIPFKYYQNGDLDKAYEFTNDIATNLTRTEASTKDPFWDNSAGSLFFGLSILLFKYCIDFDQPLEAVHIGNIIKLRSVLLSENGVSIRKNPLWQYAKTDIFIASALIGTVEAPNDTRSSILSVFDQKMRMFVIQPNLVDMLSDNTINFDTIDEKPTAIFLILPDEKTSYHNLVSLFIKQSYEYLINKTQKNLRNRGFSVGKMHIRVNYILDEFSSLPTIADFPAMITAARSRNIRFNLFIQSKHQLLLRYAEETETIQSNCNNWIFLTSRELGFLQELSALCGNNKENTKPVISVADLQRLDKQSGEALILSGRLRPHIARLPDIDAYDNSTYKEYGYSKNIERSSAFQLDFTITREQLLAKVSRMDEAMAQELERLGIKPPQTMDIDKIIQAIDARIAALDEEEQKKANLQAIEWSSIETEHTNKDDSQ